VKQCTFRLSPEQRAHLDLRARQRGFTPSAVVRALIDRDRLDAGALPRAATRDEALRLLSEMARAGSVTAARALLTALPAPPPIETGRPAPSALDELAARRRSTEGGPHR
jgi:hypothetical protein